MASIVELMELGDNPSHCLWRRIAVINILYKLYKDSIYNKKKSIIFVMKIHYILF